MSNKTIQAVVPMTSADWHADRLKHFGQHAVDVMKAEEEWVRELAGRIGYGRLMQCAQQEWRAVLAKEGREGGEHTVGPCAAFIVVCGCNYNREPNNPHCEWCMGAGWLTRRVREAQIQAENTIPAEGDIA